MVQVFEINLSMNATTVRTTASTKLNSKTSKTNTTQHIHSTPLTVGTTVMKNCEPLVLGPLLAMLSVYGRSCFSEGWNSSC